jgi:1,4-dihydroxy-2-naphthoyl-CoA synthase
MSYIVRSVTSRCTSLAGVSRTAAIVANNTSSINYNVRFLSSSFSLKDTYDNILVDRKNEIGVGIITLNRPKAFNALSDALFDDLIHAANALDKDDEIGCLIVTGSTKAFAAGADISEMKDRTFDYAYQKVR